MACLARARYASRPLTNLAPGAQPQHIHRLQYQCLYRRYSESTTTTEHPPLLLKLRKDLIPAMRAKDTHRLSALRAVIADVTNAEKTSSPIKTDMQLLSLLQKRSAASRSAAAEFHAAGREDLREKEETQAKVLEEYAKGVETLSIEEIRETVATAVKELQDMGTKLSPGVLMKRLIGTDGALQGKNVDNKNVAKIVKEALGS